MRLARKTTFYGRINAMPKKIADKGSSEKFLRDNLNYSDDKCLLWPFRLKTHGYGLATVGGVQRTASNWMARLAHGEPIPPRTHAAHSCGNPTCVNPRHLRWATGKENAADRKTHGTENIGERSGKSKLTAADVIYIRSAPPILQPLMDKFGMSKHGISKIRSGKRWKYLEA